MRRLTALSGFGVKGPACFLFELDGRRLVLDLGEGPDDRARPDLRGLAPVDAILVSHGHADHAGALDLAPLLGNPPIFCTPAARATAPSLAHAGDIASVHAVETGPAGHAPGAVWMRIGGADGLLYTGDTCAGDVYACAPPPAAAALVFDASYGAADEAREAQVADVLAIAGEGPLLLPAPPWGRGADLAAMCHEAGHRVALCRAQAAAIRAMLTMPDALGPGAAARLDDLMSAARPAETVDGVTVAAGANAGSGAAARLAPDFLAGGATVLFTGHLSSGAPSVGWVAAGRRAVAALERPSDGHRDRRAARRRRPAPGDAGVLRPGRHRDDPARASGADLRRRPGDGMVSAPPPSPFLFLRHGRTALNAEDRVCGATDVPLDAVGRAQAREAAAHLAGTSIGSIWTSPLARARATAEAVAAATGAPLRVLPWLAERDWGAWEGGPRAALRRDATPLGGEGPDAFRHRTRAALAEITGPGPVLVVAHSGTARVLHAWLSPKPFVRLGNCEVVEWRRDVAWTCHRRFVPGC